MVIKSRWFVAGIISLILLTTLVASIFYYNHLRQQAIAKAGEQLILLLDLRRSTLNRFFATMRSEILYRAEESVEPERLQALFESWRELDQGAGNVLRKLYVEDNPYPVGEKHKLDTAKDGSKYSLIHVAIHLKARKFIEYRHYYDVFIIDPDGNVVYTFKKEDDYATNLNDGPWRDSGLAEVYRAIRDRGDDSKSAALVDFAPYVPSQGEPASFIGAPVKDNDGGLLAVLVLQVPIERITKIMQFSEGMGETGETYLVGQDLLMRSNSRFSETPTLLRTRVDTATAKRALKGKSGVQFTHDYRGIPVLSAYGRFQLAGIKWAIMSEMDEAEILRPVHDVRDRLVISGIIIGVLMVMISVALTSFLKRA